MCWTSCSSYWLRGEPQFWKLKYYRERTETAVICWERLWYIKNIVLFWWGAGKTAVGFEERTLIFCCVEPESPLKDLVVHVPTSKLSPAKGQEGGWGLKSMSCRRFTCKSRSTFHFILWHIISSLLALMMWRHFSIKWFLTVQLPKILKWQNATAITNSVLAPESVNFLMKA